MTQIRGFIEATRKPGVLAVHSLDHFSMTVPDLDKARTFYEEFGFDVRQEGAGLALYTHGHAHRRGVLSEGPRKKLQYLSFGAFADDLPRFQAHLDAITVERLLPPAGFESNGLFHYVRDPWGSYSEYSADMDYIPADMDWAAGEHPGEDSFFLWDPLPPADFGHNYEVD